MLFHDRLRRLARAFLAAAARLEGVAPLLTRLALGYAFARTGWGKWQDLARTTEFFADVGIPLVGASALLVATVELAGGALLVVGLWTRLSAALLSVTMVVATFTADRVRFLEALGAGTLVEVLPLVFFLFLAWLLAFGAGPFSIDRLLRDARPAGARRPSPAERLQSAVPLVTRLVVAHAFLFSGIGKLRDFEASVTFFTDLGLPLAVINAALVAVLEVFGGAAIAFGLGTRLFAALLGGTMLVALATADRMRLVEAVVPGGELGVLEVAPLVLFLLLAWLAIRGAGSLSVDRVLFRVLTERRRARRAAAGRPLRIVVLGGGFAGAYAALELEKIFDDADDVEVTLVNKENFFLFTPMLHEVAASDLDATTMVSPIRKLLRRASFFQGEALEIDLERREVVVAHGARREHPHRLRFDHLVLALGAVSNFHGIPGLAEGAFTMKTLGDAIALRNRVIQSMEEADVEQDEAARRRALTFVVAGGGFAGVETIAGINDFARETRPYYRNLRADALRFVLVHSGPTILPELSPKLGNYAQEKLRERGVDLELGARVKGLGPEGVLLSDGKVLPTRTLVWTAGTAPNPLLRSLPCTLDRGRVVVDAELAVPGYEGVWALGDCALVPDLERGGHCPPTAQHASRQAKVLAFNVAADIRQGRRRPFRFKMLGQLASLGRRSGVASIMGLQFSGFVAWWLWRTIYLFKLPRLERRLRVAVDWTLDLFFTKDMVHLPMEGGPKTGPAEAPSEAAKTGEGPAAGRGALG